MSSPKIPLVAIKPPLAKSTSLEGLNMLSEFEGYRSKPYLDTNGTPTIGYGTTYYPDGSKVSMKDAEIDKAQALEYKLHHIKKLVDPAINTLVKVDLNQNQFDALSSLIYNIGQGAFATSSVLKNLNKKDLAAAADSFLLWNKETIGGQKVVNKGLDNRRKKERELFLAPVVLPHLL